MTATVLPRPTGRYLDTSEWIYDHIDELARSHPNQWVAVHDRQVIASGPGLTDVTRQAERLAPTPDIAYHFVDDETLIYSSWSLTWLAPKGQMLIS